MYDIVFWEMGLQLPFSDFQMVIFWHLRLAPSELHSNGVTFMRGFEIVYNCLKIGAIIPLFFYCFHLQKRKVDGKWRWVALKQGNMKLFKAYLEFVWHFKDKYILVQPFSSRAMLSVFRATPEYDENGAPVLNELGEHVSKLVYKFPFQWTRKHFDNKLGSYIWKEGELGDEDQRASLF
ncbi:unnamed protein product [Vicia faba]|uniref:Transposase (putative) gypsy type domain-containing protein n=1 Tax=Vicia faba TaxID=3906 RepID=A0AAV1B0L7_VICFA|nr:unnamed protein product [Vicia faba]